MAKQQKIRIRLKAYDHKALDQSAAKIVETAKLLRFQRVNLFVSRGAVVNMVTAGCKLNRLNQVRALSLKTKSSVVLFLKNTSIRLRLVSKKQWKQAYLPVIRWLTSK